LSLVKEATKMTPPLTKSPSSVATVTGLLSLFQTKETLSTSIRTSMMRKSHGQMKSLDLLAGDLGNMSSQKELTNSFVEVVSDRSLDKAVATILPPMDSKFRFAS
jgi:hypothetical protein